MEELDYFTVMESRIKYYAKKYDPQNKLGNHLPGHVRAIRTEPVLPLIKGNRSSIAKKMQRKLDFVISMFL